MNGINFRKDIIPLALPIFLGAIVFQIQTIANRAFLGQVAVEYLSVISNVVFPMWTMMAMINALATGATILMSQMLGAKDLAGARRIAVAALVGNAVVSVAFFLFWVFASRLVYQFMGVQGTVLEDCVRYTTIAAFSFLGAGVNAVLSAIFQASARTKPLMIGGIVRSLLNIVLDWLLIFGNFGFPQMGLLGAALATVIADFAGLAVLAVILAADRRIEARPDCAAWLAMRPSDYGRVVRMGLPTSLEEMMWNIGNLCLISFLNRLDALAVAVYSIIFTIEILPIVIFMSLGQATTVLVGRAKGAGGTGRGRAAAVTAQAWAWVASLVTVGLFLVLGKGLAGVFTQDPAILDRVMPILLVSCLTFFPRSVNFMAGSGIRGMGDTRWMLGTQVFGTAFIVLLGHLLILDAGLGVIGLFIAMSVDELVRSVANGVRFMMLTREGNAPRTALPVLARPLGEEA